LGCQWKTQLRDDGGARGVQAVAKIVELQYGTGGVGRMPSDEDSREELAEEAKERMAPMSMGP
jgi:hypothetical protein